MYILLLFRFNISTPLRQLKTNVHIHNTDISLYALEYRNCVCFFSIMGKCKYYQHYQLLGLDVVQLYNVNMNT